MDLPDQKRRPFSCDFRWKHWQSLFPRPGVLFGLMLLLAIAVPQFAALAQGAHVPAPRKYDAPVVGKPYSATRTYDYEPAEGVADRVAVHTESKKFRDSAGRTRTEFYYPDRLTTIDIVDIVAHLRYRWTVGDSIAIREEIDYNAPRANASEILPADAPLIEGVPTRHTHSVSGKEKVESSVDSWYSPDLKLAMLTVIEEPGIGKRTYRFIRLSQAEPDAALFRVPKGFSFEDSKEPPPPPVSTNQAASLSGPSTPSPSGLPHPIKDDNYLEALARFHSAVPRWLPPSDGYHSHSDVRIIDLYGKETSATVDHWQKGQLGRDEEQSDGWHYVTVWGIRQHWSMHEGFSPLHLGDLPDLAPRPGPVERRIRIYAKGYIAMNRRYLDDVIRSCSAAYAGAELCFDPATGFPSTATVDNERIVYEEWAQFNGKSFPSRLALYRGNRLQMEAVTNITRLDDANGALFHALPGVEASPNRIPASREDQYQILSRGHFNTYSYGEAMVKVHVDERGHVQHADVIDADDKSLAKAALAAAKELVYMPQEIDGHRVPFDTSYWADHWSTVDPLRIPATSLRSQATD